MMESKSLVEEKISLEKMKAFFKKAAKEAAGNGLHRIDAGDFFQSKETAEDKSLHDRWVAYVNGFNAGPQETNDQDAADRKFFKGKDLTLLTLEYQKWLQGAENNFKAAKIFKECYDNYDFSLMSKRPKHGKPAHGKIYCSVTAKDNKLSYCVLLDSANKPVFDTLDMIVQGDLTAFLKNNKSEILKRISDKQQAKFGQKAFNTYLKLKPQESALIPKVIITGQDLCFPGYEQYKYYLTKIDSNDPRAACLGKFTNCCQSLLNEDGHDRTVYGIEKPNSGFYVICKMKGENPDPVRDPIVAQTWVRRVDDALALDAIVVLSQEGEGQIKGKSCRNIDVWNALFQQLASTLVAPTYGIAKVTVKMNESHIKNMGGISSLDRVPYPSDYSYTLYKDNATETMMLNWADNDQTVLAIGHFPLHILYALSNDKLALTPSDKAKLQTILCDYINKNEGLNALNAIVKDWTINSEVEIEGGMEVLYTLYSICGTLVDYNQKQRMKAFLDLFFKKNSQALLDEASSSPQTLHWWFQNSIALPLERKFKMALKKAATSGNAVIIHYLKTLPQFKEIVEKTKITAHEKKHLFSTFDDEADDYKSVVFTPLRFAIKNGSFEVVQALRDVNGPLTMQDFDIAYKYFSYNPNATSWNVFKYVLDEAEKTNWDLGPHKEKFNEFFFERKYKYVEKELAETIGMYLLNHKLADLNSINKAGNSLLHETILSSRWDKVRFLVEQGAQLKTPKGGKTAWDLAKEKDAPADLLEFLDRQATGELQPTQIIKSQAGCLESKISPQELVQGAPSAQSLSSNDEENQTVIFRVATSSTTEKNVISRGPSMYRVRLPSSELSLAPAAETVDKTTPRVKTNAEVDGQGVSISSDTQTLDMGL